MAEVLAMFVRSVIYEQLDADGTLKTLLMSSDEHLIVALAGDYDEPRSGAFHFLLDDDEVRFSEKLTRCRRRKLGRNQFRSGDDSFEFSTEWFNVPAVGDAYYALSLPEFGLVKGVSLHAPGTSQQYLRTVVRDDLKNRFVIYLRCRPQRQETFSFELEVSFSIDDSVGHRVFSSAEYVDEFCAYDESPERYQDFLSSDQQERVNVFFGDTYHVGNADLLAPRSDFAHVGLKQSVLPIEDNRRE